MAELSKLQRAMAFQALYSALAPAVKAGGDGLRGEVDEELRQIYELTGAKTYAVQAGGVKLGTYTVVESAPVPERTATAYDLTDMDALVHWAGDPANADALREWLWQDGEAFARFCVESLGVLPDGVAVREAVVPARPASYKCGQMRVDAAFQRSVRERLAAALPALVDAAALPEADG